MAGVASRGRFRFTWTRPPAEMARRVVELGEELDPALLAGMSDIASRVESYMKANAPWNDRTGDARRLLEARANQTRAHNVSIIAKHGVPYGGFLETGTAHMSPYPILGPGLQAHYAEVRALMDRLANLEGL